MKKRFSFKKLSKKRKIIVLIAIIILILALAAIFIKAAGGQSDDEEPGETETTAFAERMDIVKSISSDGEIKSSLEEDKIPHAGYKLEKISVTKNQAIKEGRTILTYTNGEEMTAPYDCVVEDWKLPNVEGKLTNDHYVRIAGTNVLKMELTVDESEVSMVKKGDKGTVKVSATGSKLKGEVSFVSDVGEYTGDTSEFTVEMLFDNDGKVKLGMNGKARIILAKAKDVIAVPVEAVTQDSGASYVSVMNGDTIEDVEVETGISNDEYIEIKSGLNEGDEVIAGSSEEDEWGDEEIYY